jgi:WD40-like Beta Propeller Repeat
MVALPVWSCRGAGLLLVLLERPRSGEAGRPDSIFSMCRGSDDCDLWAYDARTDSVRLVLAGALVGQVVRTGHLVFVQATGTMLAAPFDLGRLEVSGPAVPLLDSLQLRSGTETPTLALSSSGTLVMRTGASSALNTYDMVWVDRSGRQTVIDSSWTFHITSAANNHGLALSPDGSRLAIGLNTEAGDDIWVKQLPHGPLSRISYDPAPDFRPHWSPDGRFITFGSMRNPLGLYQRRADGAGADSLLVEGGLEEGVWSPDGRWLLLRRGAAGPGPGGRNITGVRPGTDSVPVPLLATSFDEEAIALSPDGKWLAYQSDETGRAEVFVRPFPETDRGKWQMSNGGGVAPLWSRDGRELFYLSSERNMMAVRVTGGATLHLGQPRMLFRVPGELLDVESRYYTPWDIAPDGRFIMARRRSGAAESDAPIIVVENWFEELKAKVGDDHAVTAVGSLDLREEIPHGRQDGGTTQVRIPRVRRFGNLPHQIAEPTRVDHAALHELHGVQHVLAEPANDLGKELGVRIVMVEVHATHAIDEEVPVGTSGERRNELLRSGEFDVQLEPFLDPLHIAEDLLTIGVEVGVDRGSSPPGEYGGGAPNHVDPKPVTGRRRPGQFRHQLAQRIGGEFTPHGASDRCGRGGMRRRTRRAV